MREEVKPDPNCTFGRSHNPKNPDSLVTYYYNDKEVVKTLDKHYDVDGPTP